MQKCEQNFKGCKQEKKEEAAMCRRQLIAAWRRWWNRLSPWERIRRQIFLKKFEAYIPHVQMSEKERGRRTSEYEQEQDKASPQLALSASSGCNEGTPASSLELDLPRVRGALGDSGGAGKTGTAKGERKRSLSNSPSRRPMEDDASLEDL